jgi:signal transduction histidine kinase
LSGSEESSADSEEKAFEKKHGINNIPKRHPTRDKLVIKVKDTGIGIKKLDRIKLFRLFGKL